MTGEVLMDIKVGDKASIVNKMNKEYLSTFLANLSQDQEE